MRRRLLFFFSVASFLAPSAGFSQWEPNGVGVCTESDTQFQHAIVPDGAGGVIIAWADHRSTTGAGYDIYVRRVSYSGVALWTAGGVAVCLDTMDQNSPAIASDGAGGAIIAWIDERTSAVGDIYAQRVDATGAVQWATDGVAVCTVSGKQEQIQMVPDGSGGVIMAWADRRGSDLDIYAQRVNASGATQWGINGVAVCTAANTQRYHEIVRSNTGALIAWHDYRNGGTNGDIYAQRIDATGAVKWSTDGDSICTDPSSQEYPAMATDGASGGIIAWRD